MAAAAGLVPPIHAPILTGKTTGADLSAFQRQKEMILRESKKKAFHTFVVDNETDFDAVRSSYYFYLEIPKPKRPGGRVDLSWEVPGVPRRTELAGGARPPGGTRGEFPLARTRENAEVQRRLDACARPNGRDRGGVS